MLLHTHTRAHLDKLFTQMPQILTNTYEAATTQLIAGVCVCTSTAQRESIKIVCQHQKKK